MKRQDPIAIIAELDHITSDVRDLDGEAMTDSAPYVWAAIIALVAAMFIRLAWCAL